MFRNLTIRQISLLIVLVLAILNLAVVLLIAGTSYFSLHIFKILFLFIFWGILSYAVIQFFLKRFVFRKINLIYKFIHRSTSSNRTTKLDINTLSIDDVNADVVKWAEQTDQELKSLKSLEAYRKEFVGNISHELKTPIFSIQGYLHTLLDGGIHDDNINIKYLERAADNTERLKNIVDDLEVISKLESQKLLVDEQKFNIKHLVTDMIEDLESMSSEKNISLDLKEGVAGPLEVVADKNSIRQVVTNLLVNSIKYGIHDGRTSVEFFDMGEQILVEIADNGVGIPAQHVNHVFDRFYRVDKGRSRKDGGSGLGLSIAKHIIEAHDQTITVSSTVGKGSVFGFTLKKA